MKTVSESEMMNSMEETNYAPKGIEIPIQNLFDECLNFISITDFEV